MKTFIYSIVIVLFNSIVITKEIKAQNEKIQVAFIYNFISKYIEWPDANKSGDFLIGVLGGSNQIISELNNMATTKTVGNQKIVIKKFNSPAEISFCHVLYIDESKSNELSNVLNKIGSNPTLVITNKEGLAKTGAAINFVIVDNKQKFELNQNNATKRGLKVSADLTKLAIIVN